MTCVQYTKAVSKKKRPGLLIPQNTHHPFTTNSPPAHAHSHDGGIVPLVCLNCLRVHRLQLLCAVHVSVVGVVDDQRFVERVCDVKLLRNSRIQRVVRGIRLVLADRWHWVLQLVGSVFI